MNKDQIKGAANEAIGEAKQQVGKLTGDGELRVRGQAHELKGKAQQKVGNAKEALNDRIDDVEEARDAERAADANLKDRSDR